MFDFLKKIISSRKTKKIAQPDVFMKEFNRLTDELRLLISISSQLWIQEKNFQKRLERIYKEVEKLDKFVKNRTFLKLSEEEKNNLIKSLLYSKSELLKTIESAPCPTNIIQ